MLHYSAINQVLNPGRTFRIKCAGPENRKLILFQANLTFKIKSNINENPALMTKKLGNDWFNKKCISENTVITRKIG